MEKFMDVNNESVILNLDMIATEINELLLTIDRTDGDKVDWFLDPERIIGINGALRHTKRLNDTIGGPSIVNDTIDMVLLMIANLTPYEGYSEYSYGGEQASWVFVMGHKLRYIRRIIRQLSHYLMGV